MIDGHLGLQLLEWRGSLKSTLEQPAEIRNFFATAEAAYAAANLEVHPTKRKWRSLQSRV